MRKCCEESRCDVIELSHLSINRVVVFYKKMFLLLKKYQQKEKNLFDVLKKMRQKLIVFDRARFVHATKNKKHYIIYIEDNSYNYYVDSCKFTPTKFIKLKEGNRLLFLSERIEVVKYLLAKAQNIISDFCKKLIKQTGEDYKFSIEGIDFYYRWGQLLFSSLDLIELKL